MGKSTVWKDSPKTQSEINSDITLGHPKLGKVEKLIVQLIQYHYVGFNELIN